MIAAGQIFPFGFLVHRNGLLYTGIALTFVLPFGIATKPFEGVQTAYVACKLLQTTFETLICNIT